jgi:hypothetical protein
MVFSVLTLGVPKVIYEGTPRSYVAARGFAGWWWFQNSFFMRGRGRRVDFFNNILCETQHTKNAFYYGDCAALTHT